MKNKKLSKLQQQH